jgi:hypothetical protein
VTYWLLKIQWVGYKQHLMLAFRNPPTRQDVKPLLEAQWRVDNAADESWEFLLIADYIPEVPFEGVVKCLYGTITCSSRWMHDNGPNQPRAGDAR